MQHLHLMCISSIFAGQSSTLELHREWFSVFRTRKLYWGLQKMGHFYITSSKKIISIGYIKITRRVLADRSKLSSFCKMGHAARTQIRLTTEAKEKTYNLHPCRCDVLTWLPSELHWLFYHLIAKRLVIYAILTVQHFLQLLCSRKNDWKMRYYRAFKNKILLQSIYIYLQCIKVIIFKLKNLYTLQDLLQISKTSNLNYNICFFLMDSI